MPRGEILSHLHTLVALDGRNEHGVMDDDSSILVIEQKSLVVREFIDEHLNDKFCKKAPPYVDILGLEYRLSQSRFLICYVSIDGAVQKVLRGSLQAIFSTIHIIWLFSVIPDKEVNRTRTATTTTGNI